MMTSTIKFSQMISGGDISLSEKVPGLLNGGNVLFNFPWVFLPPGDTASRPAPGPDVDFLLRFNTDTEFYEYYNPTSATWIEITGSGGSGVVNPGLINDLAYYAASGSAISPISAAANSVLVTSGGSVPSLSTTLPSGLSIPGATITASTAALTSGQVVAAPINPTDLANKAYVDSAVVVTPSPLTESDDANVTLTLGGTPATALLEAVSLTLGWTGQLSLTRGGTNASLVASDGGIFYSTSTAGAILSGTATANQVLLSGSSTAPSWSTATYPSTTTANQLLYSSSSNVIGEITAANNGVLISSNAGIPSWLANSGTPGYVLTANAGAPPSWQAFTAGGAITTINGDSGSITPTVGVVTINGGSTGLTTTGSSSTMSLAGTLNVGHGGTGVTSVTTVPSATAFAGWDANSNLAANNFLSSLTSTVSSGSTLILTVASTYYQNITGSTPQTVQMPVVSTLTKTGFAFNILNNSSAIVSVFSSGSNLIGTIAPGNSGYLVCVSLTGTTAASWFIFVPSITPAALTGVNDTNVTATLTGSPTVALLQPVTMTLGWSGQLSLARGGTNAALTAANGAIPYSTASAMAFLAPTSTAQQLLVSGASSAPQWTTSTYPLTNAINTLLYASSANTMAALATANNGVLVTSAGGTPSISSTLPAAVITTNSLITQVAVQVFTSGTSTYTPTSGMLYCDAYVTGSGGGGGGSTGGTAPQASAGGGGGSGGTSIKWGITAAAIGASQTVTVGAAGTAGTTGGGTGGAGNASSLGAIVTANGGSGGIGSTSSASASAQILGGAGATAGSGGTVNNAGSNGQYSTFSGVITTLATGQGGSSFWGGGGNSRITAGTGNAGVAPGSGGAGAGSSAGNNAGGAGAAGVVVIVEYI